MNLLFKFHDNAIDDNQIPAAKSLHKISMREMRESERIESVPVRESEWTTVRRGKGRQRERQRDGEDPRLNYASARTGFLHKYHTSSWREKRDITTYYFTRFPDHTTAKDL